MAGEGKFPFSSTLLYPSITPLPLYKSVLFGDRDDAEVAVSSAWVFGDQPTPAQVASATFRATFQTRHAAGSLKPSSRVGPWYFLWNGRTPRNLINGEHGVDFGSGLAWQDSRKGIVARPAANTASRYYRTTPFPDESQWTVVFQVDLTSTANSAVAYFTLASSIGATPYFQLYQRSSGASYGVRFNGASDRITGGTLTLGVHTHVVSFNGSTLSYWVDGVLLGTYSSSTTGSVSRSITAIGDGSFNFSATAAYPIHAAMFQGSVGEDWARQAHRDIESVLYEPRRPFLSVADVGSFAVRLPSPKFFGQPASGLSINRNRALSRGLVDGVDFRAQRYLADGLGVSTASSPQLYPTATGLGRVLDGGNAQRVLRPSLNSISTSSNLTILYRGVTDVSTEVWSPTLGSSSVAYAYIRTGTSPDHWKPQARIYVNGALRTVGGSVDIGPGVEFTAVLRHINGVEQSFWLNGVKDAVTTAHSTLPALTNMGPGPNTGSGPGLLFMVWDRALTDDEIVRLSRGDTWDPVKPSTYQYLLGLSTEPGPPGPALLRLPTSRQVARVGVADRFDHVWFPGYFGYRDLKNQAGTPITSLFESLVVGHVSPLNHTLMNPTAGNGLGLLPIRKITDYPVVMAVAGYFSSSGDNYSMLSLSPATGAGGDIWAIRLVNSNTVGALLYNNFVLALTVSVTVPNVALNRTPISVVAQSFSATDHRVYINGQQSNSSSNIGAFTPREQVSLLADVNRGTIVSKLLHGGVAFAAVGRVPLSDDEALWLSRPENVPKLLQRMTSTVLVDAAAAIVNYTVTLAENATAADSQSPSLAAFGTVFELNPANDFTSVVRAILDSVSEAATADDLVSTGQNYAVDAAETSGGTSDSAVLVFGATATASESGSATDSESLQLGLFPSITETGSAASSEDTQKGVFSTVPETATATVSESQVYGQQASVSETGSAASSESQQMDATGVVSESGSAGDTASTGTVFNPSQTDSTTASESQASGLAAFPSITETASPSETASQVMSATGTVSESVSASESQSQQASLSASLTEAASAVSDQSQWVNFSVLVSEAATLSESQSASLNKFSALVEALTASDAVVLQYGVVGVSAEAASASDLSSTTVQLVATVLEPASAGDSQEGLLDILALISEASSASDTQSSVYGIIVAVPEAASASSSEEGLAEAHAFFYSKRDLYVVPINQLAYQVAKGQLTYRVTPNKLNFQINIDPLNFTP